ncbi:hypothetical protein KP509_29G041700 [Ceratopteris richardii]|uniref:Uncharacterized protein n=1 Tax=Ceratopteris richardii TaxID=49495 RepID=A0A8T2R7B1_CERRI|nr:hypothetical protein KP509_29G041700 [Ceratopteris richardii]
MTYSRSIVNDRTNHSCLSQPPLPLGRERCDEADFSFLTDIRKDIGESPPISPKLSWGAKQSPRRSGVEMRNSKHANLCSDSSSPCERTEDPHTADCLNRCDEPQLPVPERFSSASGLCVQKYRIFNRCFSVDTVHSGAHRPIWPWATMETNIHKSNSVLRDTGLKDYLCKYSHRKARSARHLEKCPSIGTTHPRPTPYYTLSNPNSHSAIADHCSRRRNPGISNFLDMLNITSDDHPKTSENQHADIMRRSATISASRFHSSSTKSKNSLAAYYTQRREESDFSVSRTFLPYRTSIVAIS